MDTVRRGKLFSPIKIIWLSDGKIFERQLPKRYRELTRLLKIAGFDFDIFTAPRWVFQKTKRRLFPLMH